MLTLVTSFSCKFETLASLLAFGADVASYSNMLGANHSVTQSQFPQPCIKNGTLDTGFVPNPKNHSDYSLQSFTVNVTTPL